MKIETILAQAGTRSDKTTGAVSTPIYQTATFSHPEVGATTGFDYTRTSNPTRAALEDVIAKIENGKKGFAFSSGMAAITTILMLFSKGDHLIVSDDLYGGTYRLFESIFKQFGLTADYTDTTDIKNIEKNFIPGKTKAIFFETPTNPTMKITDIEIIASFAKKNNVLSIADNTFMTPCFQRPIELGIDIVVHSATKFIGGHNDTLAGLVITKDIELGEKIV